ncbi:MAG TPA: hypothetical protein VLE47_00765 [Candidatus Saccharimonadales bacterium]|nr:hypothetical protein [Candidatus Saccharimonadales bacterium]
MVPAYTINIIDTLIISLISVFVTAIALRKWGKVKWSKLAIASVGLSLVSDLGYFLFVYLINSSISDNVRIYLFWGNYALTIVLFTIAGYFIAKSYLKFDKKDSVIFAIGCSIAYLAIAWFLGPVLFGLLSSTNIFKV